MDYESQISGELIRLLVDIGYVATGIGDKKSAESIFEGVIAARPKNELAYIGYAFSKLSFGEFTSASNLLMNKAYSLNPDSKIIHVMYGFLLYITGRSAECGFVMNNILSSQETANHAEELDQFAENLAKVVIEEEKVCQQQFKR